MLRAPSVLRNVKQIAVILVVLFLMGCDSQSGPDVIVHNANVLTMNAQTPTASAFAVKDGRFVQVGDNDTVLSLSQPDTQVIDAKGTTIVPGFNDAHLHALAVPPGAVDLSDIRTVDNLVDVMSKRASEVTPGNWVMGFGYDDTLLGRHLTRADLDRIARDKSVLVLHASLHLFVANSHAFETAGINKETPDPADGRYYRDEVGELTGLMAERSALTSLFVDGQASPLPHDLNSAVAGLHTFFDVALSNGITSFGDGLVAQDLAFAYWWADPQGHGVRVNLMLDGEDLDEVSTLANIDWVLSLIGMEPFKTPWLRAKTVKVFHGLSLSGRTARLYEPYADRPDYYGDEPQRTQEELNALVAKIDALGFQAAIHANGDYEIDMVLDAIAEVNSKSPRDHRHRIEHGSIVNDQILARMKELKIVLAPHSYIYEKGPMMEAYGAERWPNMFTNASTFEYGIPNAANSDYPVSALSPLLRIQSLVTRTSRFGKTYGPEQRLTVDQALHAYTMGGAYATFEEDQKGSIEAGKFADFVFLSADPNTVPANEIKDIEVLETYVGGVSRFRR